jgi:phosphoribosylanthranilate isomerase
VDFHLVDSADRGQPVDPSLLRVRRADIPLILAGGLTPENVREAIEAAEPFAVDVASGVEVEPGRKDPERLRAFFDAVRDTEVRAPSKPASDVEARVGDDRQ